MLCMCYLIKSPQLSNNHFGHLVVIVLWPITIGTFTFSGYLLLGHAQKLKINARFEYFSIGRHFSACYRFSVRLKRITRSFFRGTKSHIYFLSQVKPALFALSKSLNLCTSNVSDGCTGQKSSNEIQGCCSLQN